MKRTVMTRTKQRARVHPALLLDLAQQGPHPGAQMVDDGVFDVLHGHDRPVNGHRPVSMWSRTIATVAFRVGAVNFSGRRRGSCFVPFCEKWAYQRSVPNTSVSLVMCRVPRLASVKSAFSAPRRTSGSDDAL